MSKVVLLSYDAMKRLSDELRPIVLSNTPKATNPIWDKIPAFLKALESDLISLFHHKPVIRSVELWVDEPRNEHGASGLFVEFGFEEDEEFKVRLKCLIDHHNIGVTVIQRPRINQNLEKVADEIIRTYPPGSVFQAQMWKIRDKMP